jgi:long-chain acyl-CoA synthetase
VNLDDLFRRTTQAQPDAAALLGPGDESVSYGALDAAVGDAARRLGDAGVGPGACVGLHCPSGAPYIIWTFAAWRRGACVVPIPVELAPVEKAQILDTIALDFVLTPERSSGFLGPALRGAGAPLAPGVAAVPVAGRREHPAGFRDVNAAFIRFTSGTTASAKGVVLSHETIYDRICAANGALRLGPGDRVVWVLSMAYHFTVSIVGYLTCGAGIILPADHFAEAMLGAARRHGGTMIYASPAHFTWMAAAPPVALPDLRLAVSTTAAMDWDSARLFHAHFGVPISQALGIIEVGLPFINLEFAADRVEGVGRVLPAYRLRLQDVGQGPGLGEILLAGKGFLDAYYDPWRRRDAVMPDGWFHTGDVGELDADGCLFLRGRIKDMISVLGQKFFPQEVEAVLAAHPAVEAACVFGRPDPRFGEASEAQVVLRAGLAAPPPNRELLELCKRNLASYKIPNRITFVDALPRTASGKVLHRDPAVVAPPPRTSPAVRGGSKTDALPASAGESKTDSRPPGGGRSGWEGGERRRLNCADRTLLAVDRALRRLGYPGFDTQTFVWLDGRADAESLREALARVGRRYPETTARLADDEDGASCWLFRPGDRAAPLYETDLASEAPQEVLDHAARLLGAPNDPAEVDPIRFHLLHRPDGRDVFLMQYNHTLMEHNDAAPLLRQIDRLAGCGKGDGTLGPAPLRRDPVWAYLRRFPRQRRHHALRATEQWLRRLRGGVIQLGRDAPASAGQVRLRVITRRFSPAQTEALEARVLRVCGLPSLSMAILASAFRVLARLAARRGGAAGRFLGAGLGVALRPGKSTEPLLQNVTSLLPVAAQQEQLGDRDELLRALNEQMRERLAADMDLGMLGLTALFGRRQRHARWMMEVGLRNLFSLWYAYFGSMDVAGRDFCGAPIREVFSTGPAWAPVGLTLLVNQYSGRLFFQITHVAGSVPEPLADEFLDLLLDDLAG